jgi:hypothetical protein
VLLVIGYSRDARQTLRNACEAHPDAVRRRFGRAVGFVETELGAFLALRVREKHGESVQIERTRPLNEFEEVPETVRAAARAYEEREAASVPYRSFAAGTDHPDPESMRGANL